MKRLFLTAVCLAVAACAATPVPTPTAPPVPAATTGFTETMISANRYRVAYESPTPMSAKQLQDRALRRAAQLTLDKGNEWFEIASRIDGQNKHSLIIVMGKGETLAGGSAKQHDAREILASTKTS